MPPLWRALLLCGLLAALSGVADAAYKGVKPCINCPTVYVPMIPCPGCKWWKSTRTKSLCYCVKGSVCSSKRLQRWEDVSAGSRAVAGVGGCRFASRRPPCGPCIPSLCACAPAGRLLCPLSVCCQHNPAGPPPRLLAPAAFTHTTFRPPPSQQLSAAQRPPARTARMLCSPPLCALLVSPSPPQAYGSFEVSINGPRRLDDPIGA